MPYSDPVASNRAKRRELRAKAIKLLGGKCECCGEDNPCFLTVEHRRGGGKKHRDTTNYIPMYREILKVGLVEYGCLCFNCNHAIALYGECPHKTGRREQWQ